MNAKVFLAVLALVSLSLAQTTREDKFIIDPFNPDTPVLVIQADGTPTQTFPITDSISTQSSTILGGERDLELVVSTATSRTPVSSSVSGGQWIVATPNGATGFAIMQYDGLDASPTLAATGLGGSDFTARGGDAIRVSVQTDIDTLYSFTITDMAGRSGTAEVEVPRGNVISDAFIEFSSFGGSVDFSQVGSLELQIEAFDSVDCFMDLLSVVGPPQLVSPSPIPELDDWYTFDDDDNGVSPCTTNAKRRTYFLSDDLLIYYYFYGAFQGTAGFDDDVDALSANSSSATIVSFVLTLIAAVFAL